MEAGAIYFALETLIMLLKQLAGQMVSLIIV